MFNRIRSHLSYANVMASVAVFVALGGGAYAASKVRVGSNQIKKGSVRTRQLHKAAVTGFMTANDTLTGEQINESTLGTVPSASTVNGSQVLQVSYRVPEGSPTKTLFSLAGLTVTASCPAGPNVVVDATTDTNGSIIGLSGGPGVDDTFDAGEHQVFPLDDYQGDLSYGKGPTGSPEVSATFLANKFSGTNVCSVVGTVVGG
ncbi:MAG: hypothetical protein WB771_14025 [Solirubrobacterales bacterium]